jgi:SAM-dependent methyltransferase
MPMQPAMRQIMALLSQTEAVAAIGASLATDVDVPLAVAERLAKVTALLQPEAMQDLAPPEKAILRAMIRTFFRQALDLLENPGRPAQWSFDDPVILQNIGQTSRVIIRMIAEMAARTPALAQRLAQQGRFLDVGSGVGWLAMDAARAWPALSVEGIDIFGPALTLAAQNLATTDLAPRVSFRHQDVTTLDAAGHYAAAFFAGPFIPAAAVPAALSALHHGLEPDGWLFFGLFRAPPAALPQALLQLRITRSGGHPWGVEEVRGLFDNHGFAFVDLLENDSPGQIVVGRRIQT